MNVFRIIILNNIFTLLFFSNKEKQTAILKAKDLETTAEQFISLLKTIVYNPAIDQDIRFQIYCSYINHLKEWGTDASVIYSGFYSIKALFLLNNFQNS